MSAPSTSPSGRDFIAGVASADLAEGATLAGHSGEHAILVSRFGASVVAIGGVCTHYGAPLSAGLCHGGLVRCPWHHARFDLRTGIAVEAPAFDPIDRWKVEIEHDLIFVRQRLAEPPPRPQGRANRKGPNRIVIIGGGAAGFAAAEMARRKGFEGALTMLSADAALPYDRPNLSKDYLAGTAPEEWMPLKGAAFYRQLGIALRLNVEAREIDLSASVVVSTTGEHFQFDALLLATGAEPVRLPTPGFDLPNVYVLRSMADAKAIMAAAASARGVAIVGASFIALEAAASLRARGLQVHVIAPDDVPMKRVLGLEIGAFVRRLHEAHGVRFHLGQTVESFDGKTMSLSGGGAIDADFVVLGVGVRPRIALAEAAGLQIDRGVVVDQYLESSVPGVYAAGDIARYPDGWGENVRVEHWAVAERQGQAAAANMLGERVPYKSTPFFWSNHYDVAIRYVGHAETWDAVRIDGSLEAGDATVRYLHNGREIAAASIGRDLESLQIEAAMDGARLAERVG